MEIKDLKAKVYPGESCSISNCKTKTIYKGKHIVYGAYLCMKHFKDLEKSLNLDLELDWLPYYADKAKKYEDRDAIYKNGKIEFKVFAIEEGLVTASYKIRKIFRTVNCKIKFGIGSIFDHNTIKIEEKKL